MRQNALFLAELSLKIGREVEAFKLLAPYIEAKDSLAMEIVSNHRRKKDEENLPPVVFPLPLQASISRVAKFPSDYYGKFLKFDLTYIGVDALRTKSGANYFYLNSVTDMRTKEYIGNNVFEFLLIEPMAKKFFEVLPKDGKVLSHYRIGCVPQLDTVRPLSRCIVLEIEVLNNGGEVTDSLEEVALTNAKKDGKLAQKGFIEKYMGKEFNWWRH